MSGAESSQRLTLRQALELATERHQNGDLVGARRLCDEILKAKPDLGSALHLLGLIEFQEENKEAGLALLQRAEPLAPQDLQLKINLGRMLQGTKRYSESVAVLHQALEMDPGSKQARERLVAGYRSLAREEHNKSRTATAMKLVRQAMELDPEDPRTHFQYGESLLLAGALAQGFEHYEWRWKIEDFPNKPQKLKRPLWDGGPIDGKTILIHPEQGLGDSVQFCRYVPLLKQRGAQVIMAVGPPLAALFESLEGLDQMIGLKDPLPPFDCHTPVMGLPHLFGTTLETVPGANPYLAPKPEAVARWKERFADLKGLRVGVGWAGSAKHPNDRRRSVDPVLLLPLLGIEGIDWVSLQTADRRDDLAVFAEHKILDITDELGDFAETAAIVANLDIVICVDTALGHVSGAIGKPVWLLLSQPPDWRWMLGSTDTPWYPNHRLFRQPERDSWPPVIKAVRKALIEAAGAKAKRRA